MRTEVFKGQDGDWHWKRKAGNNEIVAVSGEGYKNKGHAITMAETMFPDDQHFVIEDEKLEEIDAQEDT